ncbi:efflux RND transporter periplasmic adaptor subunit [Acidiphilium multivorum]|uniref:Macrolide export protein MacA n=3 Tax=Acidiphilium TaxID=522 RepID=F0J2P6_ACIMA|nr:efflux RND transporter periplasmic adaptor subunit [Acidiphilium multivorum]MBS3023276.1 efflux RND transporter periplasmic adaptor subunit [Acidiphilium multivorum]BAJ79685.1 macrolide export protein MacA [Acidiphilium multivorum AIU301]
MTASPNPPANTQRPPPSAPPEPAAAPRRRRRRVAVLAALAVGVAAAIAIGWRTVGAPPPVHYVTAKVGRGDITRAVTATGTVNPILTVIVGSAVSGIIQDISCDYNTIVKLGQICARIDPRPYQAVVDQDRAAVAVDQAQLRKDEASLDYARGNYRRLASLVPQRYASENAADSAKATYRQLEAQAALDRAVIRQDEAKLAAAQANLGYTDIVSPVNGIVVSRNVTIGQTVAASFQTPTLFLIATDLTRMQVDTNVSEGDIADIRKGEAARFTVLAFPGETFDGTVTQVRQSPQTVQNVVTYDVVIEVDNRDLKLKPGMTASVRIITAARAGVLRVPDQALRFTPRLAKAAPAGGGARVWVLRQGKPAAVPVVTGLDDDTNTEIVSGGLRDGDEVITGERRARAATPFVPRF